MTDTWTVFGIDQGQAVERSYRYAIGSDAVIRRTYSSNDRSVLYAKATCPIDLEWAGCESDSKTRKLEYASCDNPFESIK